MQSDKKQSDSERFDGRQNAVDLPDGKGSKKPPIGLDGDGSVKQESGWCFKEDMAEFSFRVVNGILLLWQFLHTVSAVLLQTGRVCSVRHNRQLNTLAATLKIDYVTSRRRRQPFFSESVLEGSLTGVSPRLNTLAETPKNNKLPKQKIDDMIQWFWIVLLFASAVLFMQLNLIAYSMIMALHSAFNPFVRRTHLKRWQRIWLWRVARRHHVNFVYNFNATNNSVAVDDDDTTTLYTDLDESTEKVEENDHSVDVCSGDNTVPNTDIDDSTEKVEENNHVETSSRAPAPVTSHLRGGGGGQTDHGSQSHRSTGKTRGRPRKSVDPGETPPKKGRGRPRKSQTSSSLPAETLMPVEQTVLSVSEATSEVDREETPHQTAASQPVKRGSGRPVKHRPGQDAQNESNASFADPNILGIMPSQRRVTRSQAKNARNVIAAVRTEATVVETSVVDVSSETPTVEESTPAPRGRGRPTKTQRDVVKDTQRAPTSEKVASASEQVSNKRSRRKVRTVQEEVDQLAELDQDACVDDLFAVDAETVEALLESLLDDFDFDQTITYVGVLGETRANELRHGRVTPTLPIRYLPGIDHNELIQCDNITFALLDYLRNDNRAIGLMSPGFWDEETRVVIESDDPMDYLIVRPNRPCELLVIPIWQGSHYMVAIMRCDASRTHLTCHYFDSSHREPSMHVSLTLERIARNVFQQIAEMPRIRNNQIVDIGWQSIKQDFAYDAVNCAAFAAHNAIEYLETHRLGGYDRYLRRDDEGKSGYDLRDDLTLRLIDLFMLTDDEKSTILSLILAKRGLDESIDPKEMLVYQPTNEEDFDVNSPPGIALLSQRGEVTYRDGVQRLPDDFFDACVTAPSQSAQNEQQLTLPVITETGMCLRSKRVVKQVPKALPTFDPIPRRGRGRPRMECAAADRNRVRPKSIGVGQLCYHCKFCKAKLFAGETENDCCRNGRVHMEPNKPYPYALNKLLCSGNFLFNLSDAGRKENAFFKKYIRIISGLLSLGSITYDTKDSGVQNMRPALLVCGEFQYNISRLTPFKASDPKKFGQLYTLENPMDGELLNELRKNKFFMQIGNPDYRNKVTLLAYSLVRKYNPLAKGYKMAVDRIRQIEEHYYPDWVVNFVDRRDVPRHLDQDGEHDRQVNVPEIREAAMMFQPLAPGEAAPPSVKGIWVWSDEDIPKLHLRCLPQIHPLTNSLMFLYGNLPYTLDLPLRQPPDVEDDLPEFARNSEVSSQQARRERAVREIATTALPEETEDFHGFDEELERANQDDANHEQLEQAHLSTRRQRLYCSIREQIRYRMQIRDWDYGIHQIWSWLIVGFLFIIAMHFEIVRREIDYFQNHVEKRKIKCQYVRAHAQRLLNQQMPGYQLGYIAKLPKYHKLSDAYRNRFYADALAMCRRYGSPTFFITITGNPKWPDYLAACRENNIDPNNAPHIMMRMFKLKLKEFMHHLTGPKNNRKGVLGQCIAYLVSIEYQKRGNPHAHILVWIDDEEMTSNYVDNFVKARMPNPEDTKLHEMVSKYNLHVCRPGAVCRDRETGKCKKYYPKAECRETQVGDGYVKYQRVYPSRGGFIHKKGENVYDDRHVVPYNPYLLMLWDGHCNVEYVVNKGTPGYVIKYVLKGSSKVFVEIVKKGLKGNKYVKVNEKDKTVDIDESSFFLKLNYISPEEAIGNINSFGPFMMSHKLQWVGVHLPKEHTITCANGETIENIVKKAANITDNSVYSRLTAYFKFMADNPEERHKTYVGLNETYNYDYKTRSYTPSGSKKRRIVAVYESNIRNIQLCALRTIMLFVPGLTCFEDAATVDGNCYIRSVDNPEDCCLDFVGAARARGLLESDRLWRCALDQSTHGVVRRMIFTFAQVLLEGGATLEDPRKLWEDYKQFMILPLGPEAGAENAEYLRDLREQYALSILQWHLRDGNASLADFGLPALRSDVPPYDPNVHGLAASRYLAGDMEQISFADQIGQITLNDEQQHAYDQVWQAIQNSVNEKGIRDPAMFFLAGPAGVGKTTFYNKVVADCYANRVPVMTTASTGVAATLLPNGTTLHSRFYVPTDERLHKDPQMTVECQAAGEIRNCGVLIIDEATQISEHVLGYILKTLKNVRRADHPEVSRRLVILFGGDFRQLLPVVPGGSEEECFKASLIGRYDNKSIKFLSLKRNQRAGGADQAEFRDFLLRVGRGEEAAPGQDPYRSPVTLPDSIKCVHDLPDLIEEIFPKSDLGDASKWAQSAIIAPRNASVDLINEKIMDEIDGEAFSYEAINTPDPDSVDPFDETAIEATDEAMARIEETGLQKQTLDLKIGAKVIITKNIAKNYGLCNGTPAIVRECHPDVIVVQRIGKDGKLGELVDIVRCRVKREIDPKRKKLFSFVRTQFPLAPAFAMTIHKAQGQTLKKVGLFLSSPIFAPGQLYVALSRVRRAEDIVVFNPEGSRTIVNIVHPGVRQFIDKLERDPRANAPERVANNASAVVENNVRRPVEFSLTQDETQERVQIGDAPEQPILPTSPLRIDNVVSPPAVAQFQIQHDSSQNSVFDFWRNDDLGHDLPHQLNPNGVGSEPDWTQNQNTDDEYMSVQNDVNEPANDQFEVQSTTSEFYFEPYHDVDLELDNEEPMEVDHDDLWGYNGEQNDFTQENEINVDVPVDEGLAWPELQNFVQTIGNIVPLDSQNPQNLGDDPLGGPMDDDLD